MTSQTALSIQIENVPFMRLTVATDQHMVSDVEDKQPRLRYKANVAKSKAHKYSGVHYLGDVVLLRASTREIIHIDVVPIGDHILVADPPLEMEPVHAIGVPFWEAADEKLGIDTHARDFQQLREEIEHQLSFLWRTYASDDVDVSRLSPAAVQLRLRLRHRFSLT